jgi:hypothetical protein
VQTAVTTHEDVIIVVTVEVGAEQFDEERWQQDVTDGGRGLGRAERQVAADLVEVALVGVDEDAAFVEFAVAATQAGQLAPPHAGVGGRDDQRTVGGGDACRDLVDLFGVGPRPFWAVAGAFP